MTLLVSNCILMPSNCTNSLTMSDDFKVRHPRCVYINIKYNKVVFKTQQFYFLPYFQPKKPPRTPTKIVINFNNS
jgi:hypothetical protein